MAIENAKAILQELKLLGRDGYRKILLRHGAKEPCYGVKVEELKKLQRRIKKDHELALALYDSGVYDAMYLAGLIADDEQMKREDLQQWAERACEPLAGSTVAWVAAGSPAGWGAGREWIQSGNAIIAVAGWATLSSIVATKEDRELDLEEVRRLLEVVSKTIHGSPSPVRYAMNGFVIAVGRFVKPLTSYAKEIGKEIGEVEVDMGETSCRVPLAVDAICKAEEGGKVGKKRKTAKC
jgi:hypothetical protein